ncbi:hypothetical protein BDB00DRAFT_867497 [Zychaea mexicana]|uniref:uncharacterized protein n=1 Tax=Zychaea mexicana TaxID=64656 RepID=UPI0022FE9B35|nr:uncharacterized protein BDB00DRAFT_867497 [Zychaea mexicana]KAI9498335.1 hypothetical protein BDB00DRAFT_867497 [Zychaea mexicana]
MDTTDKELQAQYDQRHQNLTNSMQGMFNSVDNALHNTFEEGKKAAQGAQERVQSSSADTAQPMKNTANTTTDDLKAQQHHDTMGYNINKSAMDACRRDTDAIRGADPQKFESVGAKIEDTLGNTALTDESVDPSAYNIKHK